MAIDLNVVRSLADARREAAEHGGLVDLPLLVGGGRPFWLRGELVGDLKAVEGTGAGDSFQWRLHDGGVTGILVVDGPPPLLEHEVVHRQGRANLRFESIPVVDGHPTFHELQAPRYREVVVYAPNREEFVREASWRCFVCNTTYEAASGAMRCACGAARLRPITTIDRRTTPAIGEVRGTVYVHVDPSAADVVEEVETHEPSAQRDFSGCCGVVFGLTGLMVGLLAVSWVATHFPAVLCGCFGIAAILGLLALVGSSPRALAVVEATAAIAGGLLPILLLLLLGSCCLAWRGCSSTHSGGTNIVPVPTQEAPREVSTACGKTFVMSGDSGFAINSSKLNGPGMQLLDSLAEEVRGVRDASLVIEGHSDMYTKDKDGNDVSEYSRAISASRAAAVGDYLVRINAVEGTAVSIVGSGADKLLTDDPQRQSVNRRVEILVNCGGHAP
jgi:outer membrane protein OmpA-like peptidoglycan-associated protein